MKTFNIVPTEKSLTETLQNKIDQKTKPLGALGRLEEIALQIGLIQNTLSPKLVNPHIIVFAADHGLTDEGVSAYPQEVTRQMVLNFLNGGAGINVFCQQHDISLKVVDAGVNGDLPEHPDLLSKKVAKATGNMVHDRAMSKNQCEAAIGHGARIVEGIHKSGCNVIGFGEMGIGNTSSASLIMHNICGYPFEQCVGRGAGVDDLQYEHKISVLKQVAEKHQTNITTPMDLLCCFSGFEIAMMAAAMLKAAELKMIIMVDGFIATAAILIAHEINSDIKDYALFCHQSDEGGHRLMLEYLKVQPILKLDMRLGEGTGAAVSFPIIQSAVAFLNDMASFESAGVSEKKEGAKIK